MKTRIAIIIPYDVTKKSQTLFNPFTNTRRAQQEVLQTFQVAIKRRLQFDIDEEICNHTAYLTNLLQYEALAKEMAAEPFCWRVMEANNLTESCHFVIDIDVSDSVKENQLHLFPKRVHPYLQKDQECSRTILTNFMVKPELYNAIPDVMQCIVTFFFIGHNESYVESIVSKVKHHNLPHRMICVK